MNLLYSDIETDKNSWNYNGDVGIIGKNRTGTEKDKEQDERIDSNTQAIADNENRDDSQQAQIDANTQAIADNERRDDAQQAQLDANDEFDRQQQAQLDANDEFDRQQQSQIDSNTIQIINNKTEITRIENELPTLEVDGTTLVIGKKGET